MEDRLAALNPVLYFCHLPPTLSHDELLALVLPFANPTSIYLPLSAQLSNHGYAYAAFAVFSDAQRVRKFLNGLMIKGFIIVAKIYMSSPPLESANVFVKNIPMSFTPAMMEDLFDPQSIILSSKISVDAEHQSLGYGYVQFLDEEMAGKAIKDLNGLKVRSRLITVESFVKKTKRTIAEGHTIFVKGFGPTLTEFHLQAIFRRFGKVTGAVLRRVPGFSFAFITFQLRSAAEAAISALHNSEGPGFTWFCSFRVPPEGRSGCDLMRESQRRQNRLLVSNFPRAYEEEDLRKLFTQFGHVESVKFGSKTTEVGPVEVALVAFASEEEVEGAVTQSKNFQVAGRTLQVEKTTRDFAKKPLFPPFDLSKFYNQAAEEGKRECLEGYVQLAVAQIVVSGRAEQVVTEMVKMRTDQLVRVVSDGKEMERFVREFERREAEGDGHQRSGRAQTEAVWSRVQAPQLD